MTTEDVMITTTCESALDFYTAVTARLSRRLETRGLKNLSIPIPDESETFMPGQRCWHEYRKFGRLSFPILKTDSPLAPSLGSTLRLMNIMRTVFSIPYRTVEARQLSDFLSWQVL